MRLREVKHILDSIDIEKSSLQFKIEGSNGYTLTNLIRFKEFLKIAESLPFFSKEVESLYHSEIFTTAQDSLYLDNVQFKNVRPHAVYLSQAAESLSRVLDTILKEQKTDAVHVKLPCSNDFKSLIKTLSDIEKAVNQVISNEHIGGQLQIGSWETGSFWIELILGTQAAVTLVAGIAWSAAVISKKLKEGKILEQQVKSLEIKNESLQDILDKQKKATDLLIDQEVRHIQDKNFGNDHDKEQFERLKLAIKIFAELIQKGAEIHPSLTAPEQVQNVFPNYKNLESIASQIKLLDKPPT